MEHKLATLLRQAADDADARFHIGDIRKYKIEDVLQNPALDWKLVEKHEPCAKLKKAYADGKPIQSRWRITGTGHNNPWRFVDTKHSWSYDLEYRFAPQTETRWLWADKYGNYASYFMTEQYAKETADYNIKLEWSATEFEVTK